MLINAKSAYHTEYIWVAATGDMYVCQCDTGQQGDPGWRSNTKEKNKCIKIGDADKDSPCWSLCTSSWDDSGSCHYPPKNYSTFTLSVIRQQRHVSCLWHFKDVSWTAKSAVIYNKHLKKRNWSSTFRWIRVFSSFLFLLHLCFHSVHFIVL